MTCPRQGCRHGRRGRAALHVVTVALSAAIAISVSAAASGCLFGAQGELRDRRFENADVDYELGLPGEGWQQVKLKTADVAWFNDTLGATLLVNSHCEGVQDAPLAALANELMIGMTDREVVGENVVPFARREGLERVATGKLDGVARTLAMFVLKKDGCVYDVVFEAAPERFDDGLPAYRRVRDGLVIGPRRGRG